MHIFFYHSSKRQGHLLLLLILWLQFPKVHQEFPGNSSGATLPSHTPIYFFGKGIGTRKVKNTSCLGTSDAPDLVAVPSIEEQLLLSYRLMQGLNYCYPRTILTCTDSHKRHTTKKSSPQIALSSWGCIVYI